MATEFGTQRDGSGQSRQLLPPAETLARTSEALVGNDRGFLVVESLHCQNEPVARSAVPVDEATGVPLPVAPYLDMGNLTSEERTVHHAVFPRRDPRLQSKAGKAYRVARLQILPSKFHNDDIDTAIHKIYDSGPPLPTSEHEFAGAVAILVAGFVPELTIDTSGGEGCVRPLRPAERAFLTQRVLPAPTLSQDSVDKFRKQMMPEAIYDEAECRLLQLNRMSASQKYQCLYFGADQVTQFLRAYVIKQDPSMLNRRLMRRFIKTGAPEYGMTLLGHAAAVAAETATLQDREFRAVYADLRSRELLNLDMPERPSDFLLTRLGSTVGRVGLLAAFRDELESRVEVA